MCVLSKLTLGIFLHHSSLYSLRQGLLQKQEFTDSVGQASQSAPGIFLSVPLSTAHAHPLSIRVLGV